MKAFGLIACILVILCFWQLLPIFVIVIALGFVLAFAGIFAGAAMHSLWKKMSR